ncbi:MAG: ABC transporter permease [Deltaproteobacteria bacterium]
MEIIKRLYPYRDLFFIFTWREFAIRYRQSAIGALWAVVQPLSMMALFTFIFSYVLKVEVSPYPHVVFFFAGLLPWMFFSSSLNYSIPSLTSHHEIITKIYFPREILPLSGALVALLDYLIASLFFGVILLIYEIPLTLAALWIFPLFALLFIFTVSMSLVLASVNVYYRDVKLATGFLIQLLFFASPVLYSIDKLDAKVKVLIFLNPLTFIIENMRRCVVEGRGVALWQFALVSLIVGIFYVASYRYFIKTERAFADVI